MDSKDLASTNSGPDDARGIHRLVLNWAAKVSWAANAMFWATAATGTVALAFGVLALDGGWRLAWLVLGGGSVAIGVGTSYRLRSGIRAIIENAGDLQTSIAGLLNDLIGDVEAHDLATSEADGPLRRARKARRFHKAVKGSLGSYRDVANALSVIGTFPAVAASSIGFTICFGVCAFVFGIALLV
ncbi:MAG: hypothetical protein KJN63_11715 [Acidimicrobiia bacterium]|nr:hypothetical protein [Acidimicrobiia bacterium]